MRVRRHPERARYDRAAVDAILDEAVICHVGVVADGEPLVLPTLFARAGDTLYLHGAVLNRSLRAALEGVCVTVSLVDGVVLARTGPNHSINYRSVVVRGRGRLVTDPDEKRRALEAVLDHAVPGRGAEVAPLTEGDLNSTAVVAIEIAEFSAKVRSGPPLDNAADLGSPVWAGEVPLRMVAGAAVPDPGVAPGTHPSASVAGLQRRFPPFEVAER